MQACPTRLHGVILTQAFAVNLMGKQHYRWVERLAMAP